VENPKISKRDGAASKREGRIPRNNKTSFIFGLKS
jgi:hypothetical protein